MGPLTITWKYLTGYAVATDVSDRDRAEWPPHPARIFMALAAALFETEPPGEDKKANAEWASERAALEWLETLGEPEHLLSEVELTFERSPVTNYVPVNDKARPSSAALQSCPPLTRSKQPRSFPRTWIGDTPCSLHWPKVDDVPIHRTALDRLCRKVTRIGHSSSLVSMWVDEEVGPTVDGFVHLVVDRLQAEHQMRSLSSGMLAMLENRYGEAVRHRHYYSGKEIQRLKDEKKDIKGKGAKESKAAIDARIRSLEAERSAIVPSPPVRPVIGLRTGYRRADRAPDSIETARGLFDSGILILSHVAGPALSLISTLAVTKALRDTIMSGIDQPVPAWVSGHAADGQPLRDDGGHLALVPLPFVGHDHADGRLLGVALVFPRSVSHPERGRVLGGLLIDEHAQPKKVPLKLGRLGTWEVRKRDWQETRWLLQPEQWTAVGDDRRRERGARNWASVTPVVLDRFPKANRLLPSERVDWEKEIREIVHDACLRIGLPGPEMIDIDTTSWHRGAPRALAKRRPLRGQPGPDMPEDAALGDGFPPYPAKGTNAHRPQVHVWIRFSQPVIGPVLLGAGRYRGYGFCKPLGASGR